MQYVKNILGVITVAVGLLSGSPAMAEHGRMHMINGRVEKVDTARETVSVMAHVAKEEREFTFHLTPQTSITRQSHTIMLEDLKNGEDVVLRYSRENGMLNVHSIFLQNQNLKSGSAKKP